MKKTVTATVDSRPSSRPGSSQSSPSPSDHADDGRIENEPELADPIEEEAHVRPILHAVVAGGGFQENRQTVDGGDARAAHSRQQGPHGRQPGHDGLVQGGPVQPLAAPQGDGRVDQPTGHRGPNADQQPLHHRAGRPGKAETAQEELPLHFGTAAFLFLRLVVFLQGLDVGLRQLAHRGRGSARPRVVRFQVVFLWSLRLVLSSRLVRPGHLDLAFAEGAGHRPPCPAFTDLQPRGTVRALETNHRIG